jgi:hypothetical protein
MKEQHRLPSPVYRIYGSVLTERILRHSHWSPRSQTNSWHRYTTDLPSSFIQQTMTAGLALARVVILVCLLICYIRFIRTR